MSLTNRRGEMRISVRVPVRFRPITNSPSAEQLAESVNVSPRGIFFSTAYPLQVGEKVEISMKMPREISPNDSAEVHCTARVVHVQQSTLLSKPGVGVRVERYESTAKRPSWVS